MKKIVVMIMVALLFLTGCQTNSNETQNSISADSINLTEEVVEDSSLGNTLEEDEEVNQDMFTSRDLFQTYDEEEVVALQLEVGQDLYIQSEGTYLISGQSENTTIIIDVDDEKVQLVLDGVTIINDNQPAIHVVSADKVFLTSIGDNELTVNDHIESDDAVILSSSDLVINGSGSLNITGHKTQGIDGKDDIKITGSTLSIISEGHGIEANDSIRIAGGVIDITTNEDGLHSENEEDDTLGYIYIAGGSLNISAGDDGIRATSIFEMDGGSINISTSTEGIEATQVIIDDGQIKIYSTDDGINATSKSRLEVVIIVNGGEINIDMASGDTDGFDANGDLYINGGQINVNAVSAFDADGVAELNGGVVIVNGETITEITMQHPGRKRP